jgi:hypothetical protein
MVEDEGMLSYFTAQMHNIQMMAAPAALLVSLLLLLVYRRAVLLLMRRSAAGSAGANVTFVTTLSGQTGPEAVRLVRSALAGRW